MNISLPQFSPLSPRRILQESSHEPGTEVRRQPNTGTVKNRRIQLVLMLMEENYHHHLLVEDLANTVNLSPGRLSHVFKKEVGISLHHYLNDLRLEKAKDHLEDGVLSIKETAVAIGIPNVSHFCRSFRDRYDLTPKEYRNANLKMAAGKERFLLVRANGGR